MIVVGLLSGAGLETFGDGASVISKIPAAVRSPGRLSGNLQKAADVSRPRWQGRRRGHRSLSLDNFIHINADVKNIVGTLESWANGFIALTPNLIAAALLMLVFYGFARAVDYVLGRELRRKGRPALANVGGALLRWSIMVLGLLIAATIVLPSVKPGDLLSGLGIGSVAIGFAFKDILQNLLSGILILLRQPFRIGDQIVVNGYEGTVEDIETRATYIRTYDGRRVIIPNAIIYASAFVVNTAFDARRSEYDVGVGGAEDWGPAASLMTAAASKCEGVLNEPAPEALPFGIDPYQNTIRLRWWTAPDQASVLHTRARVIRTVQSALSAAGVEMPFPTQTLMLHDATKPARPQGGRASVN